MDRIGHHRGQRRVGLGLALAFLALACSLALRPALAQAEGDFPDRVIKGPIPSSKSATASASSVAGYPVAGGQTVEVEVDPAYAGTTALQRVLGVLGAAVHGPEMNSLAVHIADSGNLNRLCGQNSTACYFPSSKTMVVSGEPVNPNNQMPQGMVITHEYGHHIEASRSFPGWYATNLGGRHWATFEHVCEEVAAGRLFPGDEGLHYWENPGEAFAQAYATMHYPNAVPWWWSFAEPTPGAFDAIRADVADTSAGTVVTWGQRLAPASPTASTTIDASLDGPISVRVREPRNARFDVALLTPGGKVVSHGESQRRWQGRGKKKRKKGKKSKATSLSELSYSACGAGSRSFQLRVSRIAGKGKFTAEIVKP